MMNLTIEKELTVRFGETDAMGVVWHGNYFKYFEDAREFFGLAYGLEYLQMYENGYFTPIVESAIKHKNIIRYGDRIKVVIKHIPTASAKICFDYEVHNLTRNTIAATGSTIQVFMRSESSILELNKPDFYTEWEKKHNIV